MKLKTVRMVHFIFIGLMLCTIPLMSLITPLMTERSWIMALVIVAVIGIGFCVFVSMFWRCPHCEKGLGKLYKYQYCSHCGAELDL